MNVSRLLRVPLIVLYRSSSAEIIFSIRVDWSGLFFSSGLLLLGTRTSQPLAFAVASAPAPVFAARRASPATAVGSRGPGVRLLRRPALRRPVLRSSAGDSVVSRAPAAFGESFRFSGAWPTARKGRGFTGKPGGRTGSWD